MTRKEQVSTAGHLRRCWQEVADFLHSLHCDFQRVFVHLSPSGGTAPLILEPRLEGQLRRIRQRRPMIKKYPTASTAQYRCPACNCFAVLQELSEQQTTEITSVLPSRNIVLLTDCQPGQLQKEVAEHFGQAVCSDLTLVTGQALVLQTNNVFTQPGRRGYSR